MVKRDLIDITDLSVEEIEIILNLADKIIASPEKYCEKCKNKKLATLFF